MNKLEALNYMIDNSKSYDEWSEAGLGNAMVDIIKSSDEYFEKEYLDELIEKAYNY